jgi:hypothetical protein
MLSDDESIIELFTFGIVNSLTSRRSISIEIMADNSLRSVVFLSANKLVGTSLKPSDLPVLSQKS